jgi:hypothetical protein
VRRVGVCLPQLYEPSAKRTFLKRCEPPEPVSLADFYVGGFVNVFSRRFRIVAFGDAITERRFAVARSTTLAIVKPEALPHLGSILETVFNSGFDVGRFGMFRLTTEQASQLVSGRPDAGSLVMAVVMWS